MSTRLTQLNLACITAANLSSFLKKYIRRPHEGAFFFAPATAATELGRLFLFNQIGVYSEQHRARSWQAHQDLMFRAEICALAVILIATAGVGFAARLKQLRSHILQHIETPHGTASFYTIKQALHPFGHIRIIFCHRSMHGTQRAPNFFV